MRAGGSGPARAAQSTLANLADGFFRRILAWRFLIMLPIGGPWKHSFSNGSED
jgi:hypothetical protein